MYELAQLRLQSGNIKIAHNYLMEAVQLFAQVYGPIHVDIANCYRWAESNRTIPYYPLFYRVIARIHHALGEHSLVSNVCPFFVLLIHCFCIHLSINLAIYPFQAISYQHKTALMFERLLGVDNFNTVLAYVSPSPFLYIMFYACFSFI